ncbi:MAG: RNA polymerase sigma factor [Planctomycetota bacterium]
MPFSSGQPDSWGLLRASRHGNDSALSRLLELHLPALRAFVRLNVNSFLRARESCSDLLQSACREVLENPGSIELQGERSFRNWLYGAVLQKIRSRELYYRTQKPDPDREPALDRSGDERDDALPTCYASMVSPGRVAIAREELVRVEAAFDQLTAQQRKVLTLSRIVGLSHTEIATMMDKSALAVRSLLHRALARLSSILEGLEESEAES